MPAKLEAKLGSWACVSIVVGAVIGSSIFMKPATMAAQLGSPYWLLAVWVGAGLISLIGGMINAEVGSLLPETGGQYIWFKQMYGNFFAFLSGWAGLVVVNTAAVAAIAFIFAQYSGYFIDWPRFDAATEHSVKINIPYIGTLYPLEQIGIKAVAIAVILLVTFVNHISVWVSGRFQVIFSVLKVAVLFGIVAAIFLSGKGSVKNFTAVSETYSLSGWALVAALVAATSGALAAYDGWNNLGMVAGEIKNPSRNITRGLLIGLGICILLYILTTQAYLYMLPVDEMARSPLVATTALDRALGSGGAAVVAAMVMLSTLGAVNANAMPCARISFAMAQQQQLPAWIGRVHPRNNTPSNALWLHAVWSIAFVLTGSFDMLTDLFVFITWMFYGFAGVGVFILRKKMPTANRPYRVWGYPWLPLIFIAFSVFYFVFTLYNDISNFLAGRSPIINSLFGLLLTATGIPLYFYLQRKQKSAGVQQK